MKKYVLSLLALLTVLVSAATANDYATSEAMMQQCWSESAARWGDITMVEQAKADAEERRDDYIIDRIDPSPMYNPVSWDYYEQGNTAFAYAQQKFESGVANLGDGDWNTSCGEEVHYSTNPNYITSCTWFQVALYEYQNSEDDLDEALQHFEAAWNYYDQAVMTWPN